MLNIRRPLGRLIFNMGITIPGKTVFLIETAPRCTWQIDRGLGLPDLKFVLLHIFQFSIALWVGQGTLYFRTAWQCLLSIVIGTRHSLKTIKYLSIPCMNWWSATEWETIIHLCHRTDGTDWWIKKSISVSYRWNFFLIQEPNQWNLFSWL